MILDTSKIKAVIFDWGGVCCAEGEPFASVNLQRSLNMTPSRIADQAREIYNGYYIGEYNRETFWRAIMRCFGLTENDRINSVALSEAYLRSYRIYPEVFAVIKQLKVKYKVGLLSNLTLEMRDHIRAKHQLGDYFEREVYSCDGEVASMKPHVKPYRIILGQLGVAPAETLFIDNSESNIQAATELGFKTILFRSLPQFLEDIKILL